MTVFGVAGCCALMIAGFAINDTVQALSANQYGAEDRAGIYTYDVLAATQPNDLEQAAGRLVDDARVRAHGERQRRLWRHDRDRPARRRAGRLLA